MRDQGDRGFPAHAGMDPAANDVVRPRSRVASPHTRGWTRRRAWRMRSRSRLASPHTRGWTADGGGGTGCGGGFPAHAGMERSRRRGLSGFPAHAGMDPPTT